MSKLEMAHDFAMKLVGNPTTPLKDMDSIIAASWRYADAMQKEADERNHVGDSNEMASEWQPDWSQAPSEYRWYAVDENGNHGFFVMKPYKSLASNSWRKDENDFSAFIHLGYLPILKTDNWQDSLRKRP